MHYSSSSVNQNGCFLSRDLTGRTGMGRLTFLLLQLTQPRSILMESTMARQSSPREYGIGSHIIRATGIHPMCACTIWTNTTGRPRVFLPVMNTLLEGCPLEVCIRFVSNRRECWHSPSFAGTELCTVVEAMYSWEILFSIQGDPIFGMEHTCPRPLRHEMNQLANVFSRSRESRATCLQCPSCYIYFGHVGTPVPAAGQ